jgi:hypothetical protein
MGQTAPPQWWEIIVGILAIPSTIFAIISSWYVIQKAILEKQKIKLETRKLELEVLEKEQKLRNKGKLSDKPTSDNKLKSALGKVLLDIQVGENRITNLLMELLSPFKTYQQQKSTASINSQRVMGSLVELFFLLLFLYTDLNQSANTFAPLLSAPIPPFLTNITIPLLISSAGTSIVLGLMIGDLLGLTNLTSWADFRERRKPFLAIILATLVISVVLSALLAIGRLDLIKNSPSSILVLTSLAESIFIIPMLITTSFLFNGVKGILVILAGPIVLLRLPITVFRKFIARIIYYVSD